MTRTLAALGIVVAVGVSPSRAAEPALSFERDVRPILKAHCFQCHGEAGTTKGGVDVRLARFLIEKDYVVPGKPGESLFLDVVRDGLMPKGEKKLAPKEIAVLEKWVAQGAKTLRPEPKELGKETVFTAEDREWWAFRPVTRPAVPKVRAEGRVRTPIDAFLLARLEKEGLSFNADAERATLIRRACFDLWGLPPSPEDVDAFVKDPDPKAYEKLIDRLVASPRYGERWGRHWLDAAGYADSEGYNDADTPREHAWRYRDYVIRSLNADKPWDRFLVEQLAGDELVPPPHKNLSPEQAELLIATGFLRMAPDGTGSRNPDSDEAKNMVVTETVKIVSSSLLGLTVGCAECHDHRYDPILQKDFYRLRAVFEPALDWKNWREPRQRLVNLLSDEEQREAAKLEKEAVAIEAELKEKLIEFRDWVFAEEVKALPDDVREAGKAAGLAFQKDPNSLTKQQQKLIAEYPGLKVTPSTGILNLFLQKYDRGDDLANAQAENAKRAAAVRAKKPQPAFIRALTEPAGKKPPTTVLFERGNRSTPGAAVTPGDLSVLTEAAVDFAADDPKLPTTGRRLAFARHLTSGRHPLTARVLVNRFWMHHFGRGIVGSVGDFGTQGEKPSHPELLDFLADEFVKSGWSLKKFHRLVMLSTAYRQSSARHETGDATDADNRLLWRMPVRRLEAEAVRDSILAVSGKLNPAAFGPPVPVTADDANQFVVGTGTPSKDGAEFRRSVYVQQRRSAPAYLLSAFDAPQPEPNCEVRNSSTVATQALVLMNSWFVQEQSLAFADRVKSEVGPDPRKQAARAWRLAYGTEPSAADVEELTAYLKAQAGRLKGRPAPRPPAPLATGGKKPPPPLPARKTDGATLALASLCQVLLESNRFLYVD